MSEHPKEQLAYKLFATDLGVVVDYPVDPKNELHPFYGFKATKCGGCGDRTIILFAAARTEEVRTFLSPHEADEYALEILAAVAILKGAQ